MGTDGQGVGGVQGAGKSASGQPPAAILANFWRRGLKESALILALGFLVLGFGESLGIVGPALFFVWVSVAVLTARQGAGIGTVGAALLCVPLVGHLPAALGAFFFLLSGGVLLGHLLAGKTSLGRIALAVIGVQWGGLALAAVVVAASMYGLSHLMAAAQAIGSGYVAAIETFATAVGHSAAATGAGQAAAAKEAATVRATLGPLLPVLPSAATILLIINVGLGVLLAAWVLRLIGVDVADVPAFETWAAPPWVAAGYLCGLGLYFAAGSSSTLGWVGANITSVGQVVLVIHALAVLNFAGRKINLPPIARIAGSILLLLIPSLQEILAIFGTVDVVANMRKLQTQMS